MERYVNVIKDMEKAERLKEDVGCYFQVNASSVVLRQVAKLPLSPSPLPDCLPAAAKHRVAFAKEDAGAGFLGDI